MFTINHVESKGGSQSDYTRINVDDVYDDMTFTVPFQLMAETDPKKDVFDKIVEAMHLVVPNTTYGGVYKPPGPHALKLKWDGKPEGDFEETPCFVEDVSVEFDTQFSEKGLQMYATVTTTVRTPFRLEKSDISTFFKQKG